MSVDEAATGLLALGRRLAVALGADWATVQPEVTVLLSRLEQASSSEERAFVVDALLDLLSPFPALVDSLEQIALARGSRVSRGSRRFQRDDGHGGSEEPPRVHAGPADEPASRPMIERTPHLDVDVIGPIAVGTRLTASVYLETEAARAGEHSTPITLPALPELALQVLLLASDHFTIDGENTGIVKVRPEKDRSTTAPFAIVCTRAAPGAAAITATFAYDGRPAGAVWRTLEVEGSAGHAPASTPSPAVRVHPDARRADLVVRVIRDPDGDERHYAMTFSSLLVDEYANGVTVAWRLESGTKRFVEGYMDAFTSASAAGRSSALVGAGRQLFRATPIEFQEAFWRIVESGSKPLETVLVVTSEPYVPWELMIPNDGPGKSRAALGAEFAVGRWVHPQHVSPRQAMPIVDSYVIAPRYRGTQALNFSADEARYVLEAFAGEPISPAVLTTIEAAFARRGATLLHFICHGVDGPSGQILELDRGEQLLEVQLEGLEGVMTAIAEKEPFVFINACEVGRVTPALVGSGGFAAAFTRLGARCVIAPIWSVKDSVAGVVARDFYDAVRADSTVPFASILRDIRRKAYEGEEPEDSYAAYCFYGDPLAAQVTA